MFAISETMCYTVFTIEHLYSNFYRNEVKNMKPLSENQFKILEYLKERSGNGVPPSVREICSSVGIKSTATCHLYLKKLEEIKNKMAKYRAQQIYKQATKNLYEKVSKIG